MFSGGVTSKVGERKGKENGGRGDDGHVPPILSEVVILTLYLSLILR